MGNSISIQQLVQGSLVPNVFATRSHLLEQRSIFAKVCDPIDAHFFPNLNLIQHFKC